MQANHRRTAMAIEVVSPTDEFSDVVAKVREYFQYGVRRIWVILPEERQAYVYDSPTQVHIPDRGDTFAGGDILPGFTLPLAALARHETGIASRRDASAKELRSLQDRGEAVRWWSGAPVVSLRSTTG